MTSRPGPSGEAEGFGIVFLEANWFGMPVVGSRCGGIPDCVEDGVNGLLVEVDDPAATSDAIQTLLEDDALTARMQNAGRSGSRSLQVGTSGTADTRTARRGLSGR